MEDEAATERSRHHRTDALCHCTAILRDPNRLEPSRLFLLCAVMMFVGSISVWAYLWWRRGSGIVDSACCYELGLSTPLLGWYLFRQVLARRGRLLLFPDELIFRRALGGRETHITLQDIKRLGRRRNRIHLALQDNRPYYFSCSRLHGEDMFDQLMARLDELGIEVTSHERNG